MTLARRARMAASARPNGFTEIGRFIMGTMGLIALVTGIYLDQLVVAALGGFFAGGWILNRGEDRAYLEGFADGSVATEQLADDRRLRDEDPGRWLRERPDAPDTGAADESARAAERGHRAIPFAAPRDNRADAPEAGERIPAPRAIFPDGSPNPSIGRARRSHFGPVPGVSDRPAGRQGETGPEGGRKARAGTGTSPG